MSSSRLFLAGLVALAAAQCVAAVTPGQSAPAVAARPIASSDCRVDESLATSSNIVATDRGVIQGTVNGGTYAFIGIPYAAPPLGELRWRPPQRTECWSGIRDTTAYGSVCAQTGARPGTTTTWFGSEDCLYLNVWTPRDRARGERLPVLVFVHGGGNTRGAGSESVSSSIPTLGPNIQDGRRLAEEGPAVVVTLNYRLGFLGFLAHAALSKESPTSTSGNYGLMDQIAALQWVRRNIGNFGGDPDRVMLFGQSAGARDVCGLIASRKGAGLFSTAGLISGSCEDFPTLPAAEAIGVKYATNAGCGSATDTADCLRSLTTAQSVLASVPQASRFFANNYFQLGPIVDGRMLDDQPITLFRSPHHRHVPVLVSSTDNEVAFSLLPLMYTGPINSATDYADAINQLAAGTSIASEVLAEYPLSVYSSARSALIAVLTDANLVCPARRTARALARWDDDPVWRATYLHTNSNGLTRAFGPAHVIDLGYWFDTLWQMPAFVPNAAEIALGQTMPRYLAAFAATGDPNYVGAPLTWPRYYGGMDLHLRIDTPLATGGDFHSAACDFWDSHLPPAGWAVRR